MRQNIDIQSGDTLAEYLDRIQKNFKELYQKVQPTESGFSGFNADVITSGIISEDRLPDTIVKDNDINDLPDMTLIFDNKLI